MKRPVIAFLSACMFLVLFTNCRKEDSTAVVYNANFYSSVSSSDGEMSLFVDGKYIGELPYLSQAPTCDKVDGDGNKPLYMQLKPGTYKIVGKDASGNVKSSGTLSISKNRMESSGYIGGQEIRSNGDCLAIGLSY
jgi:hypothetical protein